MDVSLLYSNPAIYTSCNQLKIRKVVWIMIYTVTVLKISGLLKSEEVMSRFVSMLFIMAVMLLSLPACLPPVDDEFPEVILGETQVDMPLDPGYTYFYRIVVSQTGFYRIAVIIHHEGDVDWFLYTYHTADVNDYLHDGYLFSGDDHMDSSDEIKDVYLAAGEYCLAVKERSGIWNNYDLSFRLAP